MNENPKPAGKINFFRNFILLLALILISGNVGYRLGRKNVVLELPFVKKQVVNTVPPSSQNVDFSLFWTVWNKLESNYIDKTKLDTEKMVNGAISGMVASLGDPYTVYLPKKENTEYKQDLNGTFEGIGAQLGIKDNKIVVISPLKDHPAEKAGILAGDWIQKVNSEDTMGWTVPQAVSKIRGPEGSKVQLTLLHEGKDKPEEVSVTRGKIIVKSVEFEEKTTTCKTNNCPKIGWIKLARFGDTTNDEWNSMVSNLRQKLASREISGIILDLRNNPGGYFQSSIHIASEFIKDGVVVIQENSDGTRETFSVNRVGSLLDNTMVVLINKGSASAAEIVAGAIKDHQRAKLIGETTFGKGSIQTPEDLPNGAGLHITTARWIMPNGDWINGKGITPDIEIKTPEGTASATLDPQLDRAIAELSK